MDDFPELCCAAGVCCDPVRQLAALTVGLKIAAHLSDEDAHRTAMVLMRHFDLLPKPQGVSLIRPLLDYVHAHPYVGDHE